MSSSIYSSFGDLLLTGAFNWSAPANPLAIALVTAAGYTPNFSTDQYLSAIATTAIVATANLSTPTVTGAVASAANVTLTAVSGGEVDYIVIYENTGTAATSQLLGCIEAGTGLPFTPNGSDIAISWDTTNGIINLA